MKDCSFEKIHRHDTRMVGSQIVFLRAVSRLPGGRLGSRGESGLDYARLVAALPNL